METWLVWGGFLAFVTVVVMLDLGIFHKQAREVSVAEAIAWTIVWISLALAFNVLIYFIYEENWLDWPSVAALSGKDASIQFLTGYLLEKSLSVDNIFVIAMVFAYFQVPLAQQHRVLFWGILGAVVLRGIMIGLGVVLIENFSWIIYVFGILLLISAARMMVVRHDNFVPGSNPGVRFVRRFFPVTDEYHGSHFFVTIDGQRHATPLLLALVLVESTDIMFAIDSIPAIFAVTRDPFLVFTSNIFAILGLRSMYFVLAGVMEKFRYLKSSLVFILAYVGVKMLLSHHYPIPNLISLAVICGILAVGVLASIWPKPPDSAALASPLFGELDRLLRVSYRQARRAVILVLGSTVLLVGIVMVVLPGPAIIVVPVGLAILGIEFEWARRWLKRIEAQLQEARTRAVAIWERDSRQDPAANDKGGPPPVA